MFSFEQGLGEKKNVYTKKTMKKCANMVFAWECTAILTRLEAAVSRTRPARERGRRSYFLGSAEPGDFLDFSKI